MRPEGNVYGPPSKAVAGDPEGTPLPPIAPPHPPPGPLLKRHQPALPAPHPAVKRPTLPPSPPLANAVPPAASCTTVTLADTPPPIPPPVIFCDLDGVLTDFCRKVEEVCGLPPDHCEKNSMWTKLSALADGGPEGFYSQLGWMPDGPALWKAIAHLSPTILTGVPRGAWALPQKKLWCARELGSAVAVQGCLAAHKCRHASPGAVLIDDTLRIQGSWMARGGRFVHHTSTASTLAALRRLGVILPPDEGSPGLAANNAASSGDKPDSAADREDADLRPCEADHLVVVEASEVSMPVSECISDADHPLPDSQPSQAGAFTGDAEPAPNRLPDEVASGSEEDSSSEPCTIFGGLLTF